MRKISLLLAMQLIFTVRCRRSEQDVSSLEDGPQEEWQDPAAFSLRQGSRVVGKSCTFDVDCISGAFCNQRICRCLTGFIHIDNYCWKKIGPEESGCTYDAQCNAVWPDSTCSPAGVCNCPEDQKVTLTREGPVCHTENECPTNGANSVLFARNSNKKAECYFFDRHGQELPGQFMGCEDEPELFDCIEGFCCPTRAYACIQPMDPGEKPPNEEISKPQKRFYYNPATGTCKRFEFNGAKGNGNKFFRQT